MLIFILNCAVWGDVLVPLITRKHARSYHFLKDPRTSVSTQNPRNTMCKNSWRSLPTSDKWGIHGGLLDSTYFISSKSMKLLCSWFRLLSKLLWNWALWYQIQWCIKYPCSVKDAPIETLSILRERILRKTSSLLTGLYKRLNAAQWNTKNGHLKTVLPLNIGYYLAHIP